MEGKQLLNDKLGLLGRPVPIYSLHHKTGPDHAPSFIYRCTLWDSTSFQSEPEKSRQKAENNAAFKAYQWLETQNLQSPIKTKETVKVNYKGLLQEYCQKNKTEVPVYEIFSSPSSLKSHFGSTLKVGGKIFKTDNFHSTHKEAHQEVAEKAYKALKDGVKDLEELPDENDQSDEEEVDNLARKIQNSTLDSNTRTSPQTQLDDDEDPAGTSLGLEPVPPPKKLETPVFLPAPSTTLTKIQNSQPVFFKK